MSDINKEIKTVVTDGQDLEEKREFDTYGIMPILSNKAIATPAGEFFCQILRIY